MLTIQLPQKLVKWLPFLFCLSVSSIANSETSLWRVSNGDNSLLIGGTVHLLGEADYPLPDEFEQSFRESQLLVLETDLNAVIKPQQQIDLARRLMYNDGSHLKDHIKPSTYKALKTYWQAAKLPTTSLQTMKPALVVLTLTVSKMKASGKSGVGVDQFYFQKAQSAKKPVKGLESVETQMEALAVMGAGQEDELLYMDASRIASKNHLGF